MGHAKMWDIVVTTGTISSQIRVSKKQIMLGSWFLESKFFNIIYSIVDSLYEFVYIWIYILCIYAFMCIDSAFHIKCCNNNSYFPKNSLVLRCADSSKIQSGILDPSILAFRNSATNRMQVTENVQTIHILTKYTVFIIHWYTNIV